MTYPPYGPYDASWQSTPRQRYGPPPPNNLVWGVLVTLFCLSPLGIVSIVQATRVNGLWFEGRFDEARRVARSAKLWALWGIAVAIVAIVGFAVLYVLFWISIAALAT